MSKSGCNYQHDIAPGTGILITNLGTPAAPTTTAVRRYLREFLSDPRVVEIPKPLWWLILNGLILPLRAPKSAKLYQKIWTDNGSPLRLYTQSITEKLQQNFKDCHIEYAMRYGEPSIESGLERLRVKQINKLIILPLYPQYSATTTATTFDKVSQILQRWRWIPELHFIHSYHDQPQYIDALAQSVSRYFQTQAKPDHYLFSFHGIPKRSLTLGDPYHCYCQKTGRLLAERLGLQDDQWQVTFQSRFGKAEWLQPYTDVTIKDLANKTDALAVICPGFAVDCLETLEEINIQNRAFYLENGGKTFHYIPALNDSDLQLNTLSQILI